MSQKSRNIFIWGLSFAVLIGMVVVYPVIAAPPDNDQIATATEVESLPFTDYLDTTEATPDEYYPQSCYYETLQATVWYKYTPTDNKKLDISTEGSSYTTIIGVYQNPDELWNIGCAYNSPLTFQAYAGETYYVVVGDASDSGPYPSPIYGGNLVFSLQEHPLEMPYADFYYSMMGSLTYEFYNYSWDPEGYGVESALWDFGDGNTSTDLYWTTHQYLEEGTYEVTLTVTTVDGRTASRTESIDVFTPPPQAEFHFEPYNPSIFDNISFYNYSWDPAYQDMTAFWDFGDGNTSTEWSPEYQYAADGNYLVTLNITTADGRQDDTTREVIVDTHDVAINQFVVPKNGKVGITRHIEVAVSNLQQTDLVRVYLYKSADDPWSQWEEIGRLTQTVPVKENGTTKFVFTYTYTVEDGETGKLSFKTEAQIVDGRDAFPGDNTAISRPVKVIP